MIAKRVTKRTRYSARRGRSLDGFVDGPGLPIAAAGVGLAALLYWKRAEVASTVTAIRDEIFQFALPGDVGKYVFLLADAAKKYGVPSSLLAGIMWRESNGGAALRPPGPTGTGDFTPRGPNSTYFKYANPQTGLPPDGLGWGRGLMQIDYGVHNAWITSNDWGNAPINIGKAAEILRDFYSYFQRSPGGPVTIDAWRMPKFSAMRPGLTQGPYRDPRPLSGPLLTEAALAAYNAGSSGVLQAIAAGLPASTPTTGGEYASWIVSRVSDWAG
jgi:hypothetical protein